MQQDVTWALRNVWPAIVSLVPRDEAAIDVYVPKFGRLTGTLVGLGDLAAWADSPVTVCMNTIYLSYDVHCGNPKGVVHGFNNTYSGLIENVPATCIFENRNQNYVYSAPDMFGNQGKCRYVANSSRTVPQYACIQSDNLAVRANTNGDVALWQFLVDSNTYNIEIALLAIISIIGIAMIVDLSRHVTTEFRKKPTHVYLHDLGLATWNKIILADIIVANVWIVIASLAKEGSFIMIDPSINTVMSTTNSAYYGMLRAAVFVVTAGNAVWYLLNLPDKTDFKSAVSLRFTVEAALLTSLVTIIPKHVAPDFHHVLMATVGTILSYIAGRDFVLGNCRMLAFVTQCANILSVGPMFTMSNAVPIYTEYFIAAALSVQVAAFGILAAH